MNIPSSDKPAILSRFPGVELSYEEVVYKKVQRASVYLSIPPGQKCFAWLTSHKGKRVCFVVRLASGKICGLDCYPCCFDRSLSLGTVLYGTVLRCDRDVPYFYPEDILQFKGRLIDRLHWATRLECMASFLELTAQVAYTTDFLVFVAPSMSQRMEDLISAERTTVFKPEFVQARLMSEEGFRNLPAKHIKRTGPKFATLLVRPEVKSDTYSLYTMSGSKESFHGIACVPDYKSSVFLNGLFRNIWENRNLDNVEESESEDEFEDVSPDKYVSMDKSLVMRCEYSFRFKQWIPRSVSDGKVADAEDLK